MVDNLGNIHQNIKQEIYLMVLTLMGIFIIGMLTSSVRRSIITYMDDLTIKLVNVGLVTSDAKFGCLDDGSTNYSRK
jgi:hypothetical protein